MPSDDYDIRYLQGILCFNEKDFFEAHEVWEDLWQDCPNSHRRFYQSLIQASVAVYHWSNGNWRGAQRLTRSAHAYMSTYSTPYLGLDIIQFWKDMFACMADVLVDGEPQANAKIDSSLIPRISLNPEPTEWPPLPELPREGHS